MPRIAIVSVGKANKDQLTVRFPEGASRPGGKAKEHVLKNREYIFIDDDEATAVHLIPNKHGDADVSPANVTVDHDSTTIEVA